MRIISTEWLMDVRITSFEDRSHHLRRYKILNPLMTCSQRDVCGVYNTRLKPRIGRDIEASDQDYGYEQCNLYYGCQYRHMPKTRQKGAINRHRLSCFRGGRFHVHKAVLRDD